MERNGMDMNVTPTRKAEETPVFTKVIGNTTYRVTVHFSKTSKETITDKIKRLIENEVVSC